MNRLALFLLFLPLSASATDQGRISFLEQEVRNLQRQVQALSRQVDELRTRPERFVASTPARGGTVSAASPEHWADAKRWRQIKPGMSELEMISILGTPTSMREEDGARVLLYATEIGTSGFLGGSVMLRERVVAEVHLPVLQ